MYAPTHFKKDNQETLHQYIRDVTLGVLIIADDQGIEANHVPFHLVPGKDGGNGYLQCHLARANPVWQRIKNGDKVLVVFQGPHAYVSPSWYATKAETGKVVPTWNYLAVHAEGTAQGVQDADWLKQQLNHLTDHHESPMPKPWSVADAPADYTDRLVNAIVGVEIKIEKLTGKLKASQNQPERNQAGVKEGLQSSDDKNGVAMAKLME